MELALKEITDADLCRIRKVDGHLSVFDVIRAVTGQPNGTVRKTWQRLLETHP